MTILGIMSSDIQVCRLFFTYLLILTMYANIKYQVKFMLYKK